MAQGQSFVAELKRRNVLRAAVLYAGAVWAFGQGLSQFSPALGLPDTATRWFLIAAVIGFPFWLAFAWFYEFTPHGIQRESEVAVDAPSRHSVARKLDFAIIGVLVVAVVLLASGYFIRRAPPAPGAAAVASASSGTLAPAVAIPEQSVAVLPFVNDGGSKDQQYFSDGLSQDLINALSQFTGLKVINRDSSFQFRHSTESIKVIAQKLGVAHILEGSVQRAGGEVRVTATLVNAADGSILWSQRYDKPYRDLFALQDAITGAVSGVLKAKLLTAPGAVVQSDRPPSGSLAAYSAYQHGVVYLGQSTESSQRKAVQAFNEAVHLDPRYAAAYAQLSRAWAGLGNIFPGAQSRQADTNANAALDAALELDPDLALAHRARAFLLVMKMDWRGAEAEARRAVQLAPNDGAAKSQLAYALAILGQVQQAVVLTRQRLRTDPRSSFGYVQLGGYLAALGRLREASQAMETAINLQPGAEGFYEQLAIVHIERGDPAAARAAAEREPPGFWRDAATTLSLQAGADHPAADAALQAFIAKYAKSSPYVIAQAYAARKDPGAAFKWLDRAWAERDPGISNLLWDPLILRYRNDSRFAVFCRKVGLPDTTDAKAAG